ncbi:MAG: PRC-barrel domain-containing protein [Candidatus Magasanikbacteria bacterium]
MRISYKQLKRLRVETKSGTYLGHVNDIVLDVDAQNIVQYFVKGPVLSAKEFLVSRDQVYEIGEEKMLVYDSVVRRGIEKEVKLPHTQIETSATLDTLKDS